MDFDINAYLRLNPMDMIMVCVSTLIIIAIAKHFFWDKVLAYLDARKAAIQADIDAGMQSREAGEQYKRQYEEQMANARGEAHEILESAKANAVQEKREGKSTEGYRARKGTGSCRNEGCNRGCGI